MRKFSLLKVILIFLGLLCVKNTYTYAYHIENHNNPYYSTFEDGVQWGWNNDGDFEFSFGLRNENAYNSDKWRLTGIRPPADGPMKDMGFDDVYDSTGYPKNVGTYHQRIEADNYYGPNSSKDNRDKRGWYPYKAVWVDPADKDLYPSVEDAVNERGGMYHNVHNWGYGTIFKYTPATEPLGREDTDYFLQYSGLYPGNGTYDYVMDWFKIWPDYKADWQRWAAYWYRREKPNPYHKSTEVHI